MYNNRFKGPFKKRAFLFFKSPINNNITTQRATCCEKLTVIIPNKNGTKNEVAFPVSAKKPKNSFCFSLGVNFDIKDLEQD